MTFQHSYKSYNATYCRMICSEHHARLPTLNDFNTTENIIKYSAFAGGSIRKPVEQSYHFGKLTTTESEELSVRKETLFERPTREVLQSMSFTVNEIHVDAQFDIIQNKGMDPRPAYARSSPVIHTKATG